MIKLVSFATLILSTILCSGCAVGMQDIDDVNDVENVEADEAALSTQKEGVVPTTGTTSRPPVVVLCKGLKCVQTEPEEKPFSDRKLGMGKLKEKVVVSP